MFRLKSIPSPSSLPPPAPHVSCKKGYEGVSVAGIYTCRGCLPGSYKDYVEAGFEQLYFVCPGNSGNNAAASVEKTTCRCDAGYGGADGGDCTACALGQHNDLSRPAACAACDPGFYSSTASRAAYKECPVDTEQPGYSKTSRTDCTDCESGKVSAAGSATCGTCPQGQYKEGATCQACEPQIYCRNGVMTQCHVHSRTPDSETAAVLPVHRRLLAPRDKRLAHRPHNRLLH